MGSPKITVEQTAALRRRAAKKLVLNPSVLPANRETMTSSEILETRQELQLCHIELDMENDELHRIQVELATGQARYFNIFGSDTAGYCTLNEQGMIMECNHVFTTLLGETKAAMAGQQFTRFIFREDQDAYYRYRRQLLETGQLFASELQMVRKGGATFWVHMEVSADLDNTGTVVSLISVTDITERKQAEKRAAKFHSQKHLPAGNEEHIVVSGCDRVTSDPRLSKREMEVLSLLGLGMTSKQMAEKLGISSRTVDSHRQKIMQKLEISNGPGLVKFAVEHGFNYDQ